MLLVDDRPENLLAFEATLESLPITLFRANSAAEALEQVQTTDFAVIILDVQLSGGMNGHEVARRIKAMSRPRLTPIIFVTALDRDRREVHAGYESGAVDYLFKPLDPDVLRQKVAAFVRLYDEQEIEARRQHQRYADLTEANALRAARLLERISDAHVVMDRDFRIETVNAAAERVIGRPRAELIGRTFWEAFPAAARTEMERQLRLVRQSGVDAHFTHHFAAADRHARDLHLEVDAYLTEDGGITLFSRDVSERVRGETALRESEVRYRSLFESLDEGFCIGEVLFDEKGTAVDFRWLETNPAFVRQSGLVNAVGHTALELMPAVAQSWFDRYGRVALTGETTRFQSVAEHTNRWYDVFAFRVGRPEDHHVAILFTDVTAAKALELERERLIRELDLERARLADVFRQAPVAVAVLRGRVARDMVYELVNPHYVEMAPQRRSPVGRRISEVIPEAGDALYLALQHVLDTGQPFLATDYHVPIDRDGDGVPEDYFFNFVYHPLLEADGSVSGIVDVGTEVTESVRARREAERLQHIAEAAERRLAFLAEASARLAGSLDVEATLGTIADLAVPALADWCFVEVLENGRVRPAAIAHVRPEMTRLVRESLARNPIDLDASFGTGKVLRTGEPELSPEIPDEALVSIAQDAEHLALLRSVGLRSSISVPLTDASGRAVAVLSLVTADSARRFGESDLAMAMELARRAGAALANARLVEAERAARARADDANRAKSDFLATMSHELRTPLNAIAGHVQLIEMGLHGPVSAGQRDALARVDRAQRHLLGLINDVLNYARMEAGRVEYDLAPVLVRDVLMDVLSMVESQAGAKGLTLDMQLHDVEGEERLHVWADRDKLGQIMLNVLSNAVKFTPEGGRITVTVGADATAPDQVFVRLTDTGVGIPADKLDAVFEPFVQVRSDYTRQVEGTGLGLAISRDLARGMGGDLRVRSELLVGSTFELVLRRLATVGGTPVERRSRQDRRATADRRIGEHRRDS
ncbi:MAG: PAS domain-containing protein [Gemmatimonadaceae bacterium]